MKEEYPFSMKNRPYNRRRSVLRTKGVFLLVLGMVPCWIACSTGTEPVFTLWEGNLSPVPPSQVSGNAAAVTQFGRTEVSIQIRFGDPGAGYTWRVESGTCQGEGTIQDGPAVYPPLTASEAGTDSQNIFLSSLFRSGSQFAVKVFSSDGGAAETMVSCGSLTETS